MHIKFIWIGKTKNEPIRTLVADYLERLRHLCPSEVVEIPDLGKRRGLRGGNLLVAEASEIRKSLPEKNLGVVLDERGKQFSSVEFAGWFDAERNRGTRDIVFIIGGPDGLSPDIAEGARLKMSLGRMTWTHEMCRVLLLEQVYRAFCILHKIPYHR
jgi:23S rRNA (pseudouridine1915-N3)-methyltransferase